MNFGNTNTSNNLFTKERPSKTFEDSQMCGVMNTPCAVKDIMESTKPIKII